MELSNGDILTTACIPDFYSSPFTELAVLIYLNQKGEPQWSKHLQSAAGPTFCA